MILGEQLFAERGIEGVSLRAIGHAAGQRNNNVVQYHFGDRAALVGAIYALRSEHLNARRYELLAEHRGSGAPDDAAALLDILLRPHAESIADPHNQFLGFLARLVLDQGSMADASAVAAAPYMGAHHELRRAIRLADEAIPDSVFDRRFDLLLDFAITALAARARAGDTTEPAAVEDALGEVVAIMAVGLVAPVSESTRG